MKRVLTNAEHIFGPWLMKQLGEGAGAWVPGRGHIIGLAEDGKGPIAACLYENYNKASIMLHCAGEPGKKWLNREFLWFVFHYPFVQLGVRKIISPVEGDNAQSVRFIEHIGFTLEATLKDAAPKGDMKLYTLTPEACKWLQLRESYRGQRQRRT